MVWAILELRKHTRWRLDVGPARAEATKTLRKFLPVLIGLGTLQLNTLADTVIAMWPTWIGPTMFGRAVPMDEASNAVLGYTQRLYQFPLGVFGIAVATAAFPALARAASDKNRFTETVAHGLRLSLFIGLPATIGLLIVREDLVRVMFSGGGGFSEQGLTRSAAVLAGYAAGVFAYSLNHVLSRAFYALDDTATPMRHRAGDGRGQHGVQLALDLVVPRGGTCVGDGDLGGWANDLPRVFPAEAADGGRGGSAGRSKDCAACVGYGRGCLGRARGHARGTIMDGPCGAAGGRVGAGIAAYIGLAVVLKSPELRWLVKGT